MNKHCRVTQFAAFCALLSAIGHPTLQADTYVNRRYTTPTDYVIEPKVVSGQETWSAVGSPYIVEGYDYLIDIPAGASLTIEAGALVYFPYSRDGSGINVNGDLRILGTAQSPVRLMRDPSQDTGTWSGIRFNTNSTGLVQDAVLDDSGHETSGWQAGHPGAAIYIYGSSPTIRNVTINRSGGRGIRVEGVASPQVEGCQIVQALREAILWQNFTGGSPRFLGTVGSSNGMNAIFVGNGELTTDMVLQANSIPYYLQGWDGNLTVGTNATLTIDENVIMKCYYGRDGGALDVRGRLQANGSASAPIIMTCAEDDAVGGDTDNSTNAPVAGNWSGIRVMEGGQGDLRYVTVRYAGHVSWGWQGWHPAASVYCRNAQAMLDNCTIEFSQDAGVRVNQANVTMTGSQIRNGGGSAVDVENGGLVGTYDFTGTTATGNNINGIVMRGELAGDLQLGNYAMPYVVAGWVTVPVTNALAFAPGTRVMFVVAGDSYIAGINVNGTLSAVGQPGNPVVFTSIYDTNTVPNVYQPPAPRGPAPADWNGLIFQSGSTGTVEYCVLRYAGSLNENWNGLGGGAIAANGASPQLRHLVISDVGPAYSGNSGHGIRFNNSSSQVSDVQVERANQFPVYVLSAVNGAFPQITGLQASNCGVNGVRLPTSFNADVTLGNPGVPYVVDPSLDSSPTNTVRIQPGVIIKFRETAASWDRVWINEGPLLAEGTAAAPIVFTTICDDTVGGDTNNDGDRTTPLDGPYARWCTVQCYADSTFDHCLFRYGSYANANWTDRGGGMIDQRSGHSVFRQCQFFKPGQGYTDGPRGMIVRGGEAALYDCVFTDIGEGVRNDGGQRLLAHNCRFEGQTGYGLLNNNGAMRVDARYCWWGQASGPTNPDNPGGNGTAVGGPVDFKPWIGGDPQTWTDWRASRFTPEQLADPAITDPAADPDHDGLNNWQEYIAGTNPTNAVSTFVLAIAAETAAAGTSTNVVLSWPTVSGRTYRLYRAAGLEAGAVFEPVAGPIEGTGAPITVTNSLPPAGSRFFYRLSVE